MFTAKERKLLELADTKPDLQETADAIRTRRKAAVEEACARLRAEGKL